MKVQCRFCCHYPMGEHDTKCMWCDGYRAGASTRISASDLAELRALVELAEKATAGPWSAEYKYALLGADGVSVAPDRGLAEDGDGIRWEDKEFIAAARNAIPALRRVVGG